MKDELTYNEREEWAKTLYTRHDKNIRDIALIVGVEEADVRHWIKVHGWDIMKRSLLISKSTQLEHLYDILEQLNAKVKSSDAEVNTKNVDLIIKYTAAIKNLEADISVSNIIEVAELFIQYLRRKDLPLTKKVIVQFDAFIKQKLAA